jgi:biotin carboxylase
LLCAEQYQTDGEHHRVHAAGRHCCTQRDTEQTGHHRRSAVDPFHNFAVDRREQTR